MSAWRLLKLETKDAFTNMAIDEAILSARTQGKVPNTVRFFMWNPSAVSIGRFQNVSNEVYLKNCRKHGVDIVRRITGGGAVYHDCENEITYSAIVSEKDLGSVDVFHAYRIICSGLIEAVKILGVNAGFNPGAPKQCPNITVDGRKISGSAQSRKRGILLQHGTLLLDVDLKKMFMFLKVPWAKTCMDVVDVAQRKITSVKHEIGKRIPIEKIYEALVRGFEKTLESRFEEAELVSYELETAERLCRQKFATNEWNFKGEATL